MNNKEKDDEIDDSKEMNSFVKTIEALKMRNVEFEYNFDENYTSISIRFSGKE